MKTKELKEVNPEATGLAAKAQAVAVQSDHEMAIDRQFAKEGEVFELSIVETKVVQLQQIAGQSILEMGRLLTWTKERVGHGNFIKSLKRMNISQSTAKAYIQVYTKLQKSNRQPVVDLGITKALELVRNYEEEELEALADGQEVDGRTLDEFAGMSRTELKTALRSKEEKYKQNLEAVNKQADALQKRNSKLAQQVENYESGSDRGWEFAVQWLERMSKQGQAIHSAAKELESLAVQWAEFIENGDQRALAGQPFLLSNLSFYQNLVATAIDQCDGALQQAMAAHHPDLQFPAGTQYPALGFSRNNLPKNMKFNPASVEEADNQEIDFEQVLSEEGFTEEKPFLFDS